MPPDNKSRYNVLPHFTIKLAEAFHRQGVQCRILKAEKSNPKPFLDALYNDPPDCTLSFNGLLPDHQGLFFCDMIKIPHVAMIIDSPTQYLALASSPYTIITLPDRFSCQFFKGLKCENVLFIPHAIEKDLAPPLEDIERKFDVTMLSSCIDYESMAEQWPFRYPQKVVDAMYEAIEIVLSDNETSCIQAFIQTMDRRLAESQDIKDMFNYPQIIDEIEMYTKGKERVELIRAIKDAQVHIFGSHIDLWQKYLSGSSNVNFHEFVNYDVALEIMKQSKIILNSCAWMKDGTHERILAGLACGALVFTNENIYMQEYFRGDYSIAFYQTGELETLNLQVNHYLSRPEKRARVVERGRDIVMRKHTWDQRAKTLLKELPQALRRIEMAI